MDEALDDDALARVQAVLAGFAQAHPARFDHIASRVAGQRRYVDLHLHLPSHWTLARAAALRGEVERALMAAVPGLRASIQLLPTDVETLAMDEEHLV
jgi:divalent metal cation (Fe/Co/Zn/Cd) transporter